MSLSDPPLTFAQPALNVSCCKMKATRPSSFLSLVRLYGGWHKCCKHQIFITKTINHRQANEMWWESVRWWTSTDLQACISNNEAHPVEYATGTYCDISCESSQTVPSLSFSFLVRLSVVHRVSVMVRKSVTDDGLCFSTCPVSITTSYSI